MSENMAHTRLPTYLHIALLALLFGPTLGEDAKCYYPNGQEAVGSERPCSSAAGSACCPEKWECLDNGLCHYEPDDLFGRYSCTDQSWKAPGCPSNLCTYDLHAVGGESITQCDDNDDHEDQWCCNADAQHVDCCRESPVPRPFFNLRDGHVYAVVGATLAPQAPILASITGMATSGGSQPSSTPAPSSSDRPSSSNSPSSGVSSAPIVTPDSISPITSYRTSVSSGSNGISTIVITSVISVTPTPMPTSTSTPPPADPSKKKSNLPVIVGCAVGIPLGLALIGIIFWLFRKRSQNKKHPYSTTPEPYAAGSTTPEFTGGAAFAKANGEKFAQKRDSAAIPDNGVAELGGEAIGPGKTVSTMPGHAELASGAGFQAGTVPYAPGLVGVGGGNGTMHTPQQSSWGSGPPGYSPGMTTNEFARADAVAPPSTTDGRPLSEAPDTSVRHPMIPPAGTTLAGQQHSQTDGGRYIPYRPPPGHSAHVPGIPEVPEMSTVQTPPAAELGVKTPPA